MNWSCSEILLSVQLSVQLRNMDACNCSLLNWGYTFLTASSSQGEGSLICTASELFLTWAVHRRFPFFSFLVMSAVSRLSSKMESRVFCHLCSTILKLIWNQCKTEVCINNNKNSPCSVHSILEHYLKL